jgi:hypothetical protein
MAQTLTGEESQDGQLANLIPSPTAKASKAHLVRFAQVAGDVGWESDALSAWLHSSFGESSAEKLTEAQIEQAIRALNGLVPQEKK